MAAASNEPAEELAVDSRTPSYDCLSHLLLVPTDGGELLQTRREETEDQ